MGGSMSYHLDEPLSDPRQAVEVGRQIVRCCGVDPELGLTWETSRLDAVETVGPLLAGAEGSAQFHVEDPGPLTAALREAGLDPLVTVTGGGVDLVTHGYARILDALDHAALATRTVLSIDLGYREDDPLDEATLDRLVAVAGDDAFSAYWSCSWFGATSWSYNGVSVRANGDVTVTDGHRPGQHEVVVGVNHKLDDPGGIAERIAATTGRSLVYRDSR